MNLRFIVGVVGLLTYSQMAYNQSYELNFFLRHYITTVRIEPRGRFDTGVLYELTDSTLILAPIEGLKPKLNALIIQRGGSLPPTDSLKRMIPLRTYRYSQLSLVTVHRRGRGAKGLLVGALVGLAAGFIHGGDTQRYSFGPRFGAGDYAIIGGLALAVPGALVGAVINRRVRKNIAVDVPRRFRKLSIVEQVKKATLYSP